jgi:ankyrin repeat protein
MMRIRLPLAILILMMVAAGVGARQPDSVPRCPEGTIPADFDPSNPKSAVEVMRGAPRIALALGRDRHAQIGALLARGEDPNVCVAGSSLLAVSAISGDLEEIRILLDGGAHLESPLDSNGGTALLTALGLGRYASARLLIERGADVLATDDGHMSALVAVASSIPQGNDVQGQVALAKLLLDKGVPVDTQMTVPRDTALMFAAIYGNRPLVQLLLSRGADPRLTTNRGETAEGFARKKGFSEVADLIAAAGAARVSSPAASGGQP